MRGRYCRGGAMAPFDGRLLNPVLAACFCGRWRTCMGRTAADHRRRGFKRRVAYRGAEIPRQLLERRFYRTAALEISTVAPPKDWITITSVRFAVCPTEARQKRLPNSAAARS